MMRRRPILGAPVVPETKYTYTILEKHVLPPELKAIHIEEHYDYLRRPWAGGMPKGLDVSFEPSADALRVTTDSDLPDKIPVDLIEFGKAGHIKHQYNMSWIIKPPSPIFVVEVSWDTGYKTESMKVLMDRKAALMYMSKAVVDG